MQHFRFLMKVDDMVDDMVDHVFVNLIRSRSKNIISHVYVFNNVYVLFVNVDN
jgi:hypothetical protein